MSGTPAIVARLTPPGHLLGVYFHSVNITRSVIVWQVNFLPVFPGDGETQHYFAVAEVDPGKLMCVPGVSTHRPSVTQHAVSLALWELPLRLNNPILRTLDELSSGVVVLRVTDDRVLLGAETSLITVDTRVLTCAYLHCESSLTYPDSSPRFSGTREFWHGEIYGECDIGEIGVYLKTRRGLYQCHSGQAQTPKREKGRLDILDVFLCREYKIKLQGSLVVLLVAHVPDFHVLWTNPASKWNGVLPEFLRALHDKLFGGRDGLPPAWMYVFPGAVPHGTTFDPYLPSFPCLPLRYGSPEKVDRVGAWRLCDPRILAHFEGILRTTVADVLLGAGDVKLMGTYASSVVWQTPVCDVNLGLCEADERTAIVRESHVLISMNLEPLVRENLHWASHPGDATLDTCLRLGSPVLVQSITAGYNCALSAVLSWATSRHHRWAAINRWCVFLILKSAASQHCCTEIADLRRACQVAGFGLQTEQMGGEFVFSMVSDSVYTTAPGYFLHASLREATTTGDPCPVKSWVESISFCLARFLLRSPDHSPIEIIEEVMPHYFLRRRESAFWLVPREMCKTEPACPSLPIDCVQPRRFLVTKSGPVCWWEEFPLPTNVDYGFYLGESLRILLAVGKQQPRHPDVHELTQLDDWSKVLSLF
ncbi:helicase-primase subunit [Colobine gammaherpesvirus 1]|uniref:Helicase-primase subunit n=1 Tax=Colobine gammaherpesvirus 1 TaxID=2597325 RepID=A0A5B8G8Z1_9GAMA|nr:helicase-primase subunit [Colobine gammaherpesvirus 1]QDQ69248.1 helicase-primase subunit [Colobine gammaherpesvirus 1]